MWICAMGEIKGFAWRLTVVLSTLKISGPALNEGEFTLLKWLFFFIVWIFRAYLGQFSSVLIHIPCPVHNSFQDNSVRNDNQTNPPWAKRCKFALDTTITPKFYKHHGRWCHFTLVFLFPRSFTINSSLKGSCEAFNEALFGYRVTVRAFKLLLNY